MGVEAPADQRPVLASLAEDGSVALWDLSSRRLVTSWTADPEARHVAILPLERGPVVAVATRDTVEFHDVESSVEQQGVVLSLGALGDRIASGARITTMSVLTLPWGRDLAVGLSDGSVAFVADETVVASGLQGDVVALADGEVDGQRVMVAADAFGDVRLLWDPRRSEPAERFEASRPIATAVGAIDPNDPPDTWQRLQQGATGPAVRELQARLGAAGSADLVVDGRFGPATEAALRAYQREHALEADGVCGEQSWSVLLKEHPTAVDGNAASVWQLTAVGVVRPRRRGRALVVATTRALDPPDEALELEVWDVVRGERWTGYVVDEVIEGVSGRVRDELVVARAFRAEVPPVFEVLDFGATPKLDGLPVAVGQTDGSVRVLHDGGLLYPPLVHHAAPVVALARGLVETVSEAGRRPGAPGTATGASAEKQAASREPATQDPGDDELVRVAAAADRVRASAGFQADRVDHDGKDLPDHLRVGDEVEALCSVIMHREVRPPVSIGLFGDWGSGKTYFMALMQQRIAALRKRAKQAEATGEDTVYCSEVAQIRFNAWHFVDANLWAGIVTRIFEGLAEYYTEREVTRWDEALELTETAADQLHRAQADEQRARAAEQTAAKAADQAEAALQQATTRYEEAEQQGVDPAAVARAALREGAAAHQVAEAADELGLARVPRSLDEVQQEVRRARSLAGRLGLLWRSIGGHKASAISRVGIVAIVVAVVVVPTVVAWMLTAELVEGARAVVTAATAWLVAAFQRALVVRPWLAALDRGIARLETAVETVQREVTDAPRREVAERWEALQNARAEHEARKAEAEAQHARVEEAKERAERIRTGAFVADLIRERRDDPAYRSQLGIIDVIRRDFQGLSRLLDPPVGGERGEGVRLDRIVLYIDDLDRCPSERVVEVLQAVHLLLAFELFVVVVGVDSRWLLHALEEQYSAFGGRSGDERARVERGSWTTTPQHYLEKIFQIPLTLRPMNRTGFASLVEAMTHESSTGSVSRSMTDEPDEAGARSADAGGSAFRSGDGVVDGVSSRSVAPAETDPGEAEPSSGTGASPQQPSAGMGDATPRHVVGANARGAAPDEASTPARSEEVRAPDLQAAAVGGGQRTTDPASVSMPTQAAKRDAADEGGSDGPPIDPSPPQLQLTPDERAFLSALDALIPTPRAAKRFVNVYRLIKATLPLDQLERFEGDATTPGEYQAAMLLLALQTGHPAEAAALFGSLQDRRDGGWWDLVAELGQPLSEGDVPSDTPWRPAWDDRGGYDQIRWRRLRSVLEAYKDRVTLADDLSIYRRHVGTVARYGFLTGRTLIDDPA